jgi:hypothetical protein
MFTFFVFVCTAFVFYNFGWVLAHKAVATECRRLGGFYVDDKTFKCVEIIQREEPNKDGMVNK